MCESVSGSVVSDSLRPHKLTCQAPLSIEFSRQEYWSGLLFPSSGDLPDPEILLCSLTARNVKCVSLISYSQL